MEKFFVGFLFGLILTVGAFAQVEEFNLGVGFAKSGDFQTALQHFQKAYDKNLSDKQLSQIHYNIGVCFYRLNQPRKAVAELEKAISLRKGYEKAFYALGMAQTDLQNWQAAEIAFRQSIELSNGRHGEAWFDLALVLIEQKNFEEAVVGFQNAIKFGSKASPDSKKNLETLTDYLSSKDKSLLAKLSSREVL